MTTASTYTTISNANTAAFRVWVSEIITNLVTNCGIPQTTDTGQINLATVTLPIYAYSSAGYVVLKFNDTLQATSPVFIKLEFGTGGDPAAIGMWITVGTGSDGAGNLTGTVTSRLATTLGADPLSTTTNYVSRYCYNATAGVCWMGFKVGGYSTPYPGVTLGGFAVFRSINATGATTGNSVTVASNTNSPVGSPSGSGYFQVIDFSTSTAYGQLQSIMDGSAWTFVPFNVTSTLVGTAGNVFPVFQFSPTASAPALGITNALAFGVLSELAVGTTVSLTIVGSTTYTYISAGSFFSGANITSWYYPSITYSVLAIWQ